MQDTNDKRQIAHDEWLTEPIDDDEVINHPALCDITIVVV